MEDHSLEFARLLKLITVQFICITLELQRETTNFPSINHATFANVFADMVYTSHEIKTSLSIYTGIILEITT